MHETLGTIAVVIGGLIFYSLRRRVVRNDSPPDSFADDLIGRGTGGGASSDSRADVTEFKQGDNSVTSNNGSISRGPPTRGRRSPVANRTSRRERNQVGEAVTIDVNQEIILETKIIDSAIRQLKSDEGFESHWYQDNSPQKHWTIGYGFKVNGLTAELGYLADWMPPPALAIGLEAPKKKEMDRAQGESILTLTVVYLYPSVRDLIGKKTWRKLSIRQRAALLNMAFQLGVEGLRGFNKTISYLRAGRYAEAAEEAKRSDWRDQTPNRAARVAAMLTG